MTWITADLRATSCTKSCCCAEKERALPVVANGLHERMRSLCLVAAIPADCELADVRSCLLAEDVGMINARLPERVGGRSFVRRRLSAIGRKRTKAATTSNDAHAGAYGQCAGPPQAVFDEADARQFLMATPNDATLPFHLRKQGWQRRGLAFDRERTSKQAMAVRQCSREQDTQRTGCACSAAAQRPTPRPRTADTLWRTSGAPA